LQRFWNASPIGKATSSPAALPLVDLPISNGASPIFSLSPEVAKPFGAASGLPVLARAVKGGDQKRPVGDSKGVTAVSYDAPYRPVRVTDADAGVTTYVYVGFGDAIQSVSPDSGTTVYRSDLAGNPRQKTDGAGLIYASGTSLAAMGLPTAPWRRSDAFGQINPLPGEWPAQPPRAAQWKAHITSVEGGGGGITSG
jgi:YD repeat-containing protein